MRKKTRPSPNFNASDALRRKILDSLLAHVPFDGWTEAAYANALRDSKITMSAANACFPEAIRDCVEYFGDVIDEAMQKRIDFERGFERLRVRDKITFAVRARLEHLAPHREALRRLMIWYAMPHHMPMGIKRFYKTVDLIWTAAGDTSTDYNFYTKRILLAAVVKATLLFWLNDETPNNAATWDFLDRRIADVMKLGKGLSLMKEFKPSEVVELVRNKIKKAI